MRLRFLLALTLVLVASCGGDKSSPSPGDGPVKGATEASLRKWYGDFATAFKSKDWAKTYTMMSPDYRSQCSVGDFSGQMLLVASAVGESYFRADLSVSDIVITGNRAKYTTSAKINGQVVTQSTGVKAVFIDGRWYSDSPCSTVLAAGSPTPVPPLAFGQTAPLPSLPGFTMTVLSITAGTCDGGSSIVVGAEISNNTDQASRNIPPILVRSPDGQQNANFTGFSDYANFYTLPQGLPARASTRAFYCVATDNHSNRGQFTGQIPSSFSGWVVDTQVGPRWQAR